MNLIRGVVGQKIRSKVVQARLSYEEIALELGTSLGGVTAHCKKQH